MSRRAAASVAKEFAAAATQAYAELAEEFGLEGPHEDAVVLPSITFSKEALEYQILHNHYENSVHTHIRLDLPTAALTTDLANLVHAACLGPAQQVKSSAHTVAAMRRALETQAAFVRQVHPLLASDAAEELMRSAGAREWPHHR